MAANGKNYQLVYKFSDRVEYYLLPPLLTPPPPRLPPPPPKLPEREAPELKLLLLDDELLLLGVTLLLRDEERVDVEFELFSELYLELLGRVYSELRCERVVDCPR
jgi:hypothetical protein